MPDLTTEYFWRCDEEQRFLVPSSKSGMSYEVMIRGWDASCTCPAFKFHPDDHCKHIKRAFEMGACRWNQMLEGGEVGLRTVELEDGDQEVPCCPNCGGVVTSFGVAV